MGGGRKKSVRACPKCLCEEELFSWKQTLTKTKTDAV
jgi:hypothetical protein